MILQRYMLLFIIAFSLFTLIGCGEFSANTYNKPYVEDGFEEGVYIRQPDQEVMCEEKPDSMFCSDQPTLSDIQPTYDYATDIVMTLRKNTNYVLSDDWHYAGSIYEQMDRDCEDEAMEMINQMVNEGIDKKYLFMVHQIWSATESHIFVGIEIEGRGLMHMDVNTILKPIEPQLNFHMRMNDAGADRWIKGNIK